MPAAVGSSPVAVVSSKEKPSHTSAMRRAAWSLLEVAPAGFRPVPFGILLVDSETDELSLRCRTAVEIEGLDEQQTDILELLADDLKRKARENGGTALISSFEESFSGFFRISDRTAITYAGDPQRTVDRLFDEHVDSEVRPFVTHLPLFGLKAAATKFGEGMAVEAGGEEAWIRVPDHLRPAPGMFVARVVGKSMEPLIPDDSLCVFRANVAGSRRGKYLLIEKFGETDFGSRYTVKRYTSEKSVTPDGEDWGHKRIRLEPLNRDFEAFELGPDEFRVVAEFAGVL